MILLDTCAILWDALAKEKLSKKALNAIEDADENNALIISDISIWEIAMLNKRHKIELSCSSSTFMNLYLQSRNISVKQITPEIAEKSVNFESDVNNDPADRIIAATSIINNARLVTADSNLIQADSIDTLW